jgi:hypothetical protein
MKFAVTRLSQGVPVIGDPHEACSVLRTYLRGFQASIYLVKTIPAAFVAAILIHYEKLHPSPDSRIG